MRLSEEKGGYRITVFTAPTPFRAGLVDISVLVQDASTLEPVPGVRVNVQAAPRGRPDESVGYPATAQAATNKLFNAAVFELPEAGWWDVQVSVEGTRGPARLRFEVEAAERLPGWLALWPWIAWPCVVILVFSVHQRLVRRRYR